MKHVLSKAKLAEDRGTGETESSGEGAIGPVGWRDRYGSGIRGRVWGEGTEGSEAVGGGDGIARCGRMQEEEA